MDLLDPLDQPESQVQMAALPELLEQQDLQGQSDHLELQMHLAQLVQLEFKVQLVCRDKHLST